VFYDSFDVIDCLFQELPLDPTIADRKKHTALDFARKLGKTKAEQMIQKYISV
jgi:hypothetical protein